MLKHIDFELSHKVGVMKRARDQKEVQTAMNKYELALVVNAKIEDDARVATVEKAKEYVTKFGGNITNVEEWGKKKLAYEIQHMKEGFYYSSSLMQKQMFLHSLSRQSASWTMFSDTYALDRKHKKGRCFLHE